MCYLNLIDFIILLSEVDLSKSFCLLVLLDPNQNLVWKQKCSLSFRLYIMSAGTKLEFVPEQKLSESILHILLHVDIESLDMSGAHR